MKAIKEIRLELERGYNALNNAETHNDVDIACDKILQAEHKLNKFLGRVYKTRENHYNYRKEGNI